eukprot:gene4267-2697_t
MKKTAILMALVAVWLGGGVPKEALPLEGCGLPSKSAKPNEALPVDGNSPTPKEAKDGRPVVGEYAESAGPAKPGTAAVKQHGPVIITVGGADKAQKLAKELCVTARGTARAEVGVGNEDAGRNGSPKEAEP